MAFIAPPDPYADMTRARARHYRGEVVIRADDFGMTPAEFRAAICALDAKHPFGGFGTGDGFKTALVYSDTLPDAALQTLLDENLGYHGG